MNIDNILKTLKSAGYTVGFDSENILIDLPDGGTVTLDDRLRAEILHHKPEILFFLRMRAYNQLRAQAESLGEYLNSSAEPLPARKARLPEYENLLDEIAVLEPVIQHYEESGLCRWYKDGFLLLYSQLLAEIIVLIRDPEIKLPPGCSSYPLYRLEEVTALSGKTDEVIKAAHLTKKVFTGQVKGGRK